MKRMKKLAAILLTAAALFTLAGCKGGKEPTAEELIAGVPERLDIVDADMTTEIRAAMSIDGAETIDMSETDTVNIKSDGTHTRMTGTMVVDFGELYGAVMNDDIDRYIDGEAGIMYDYDFTLEKWSISEDEYDTESDAVGFNEMSKEFKDPVMQPHSGSDDYIVTASIDPSSAGLSDDNEASVQVTLTFGYKDHQIKSLKLDAVEPGEDGMDTTMTITIILNQIDGQINVDIPAELPTE